MPEYVHAPIPIDPEQLTEEAYDIIRAGFPDWEPSDANLDVWLIECAANIGAQVGEAATDVLRSVFRYYGDELVNVPPLDAATASGLTTWTMIDTDGHTIPAGTVVAFDNGEQLIEFETVEETTIPDTEDTATGVEVVAVIPGVDGNDLTGDGELIDTLDFLDTVVLESATGGGEDEEDDDTYLNRLVAELQLLTPRPILPNDFAVLAKRISGVERATAINGYNPDDDTEDNERMVAVAMVDEDGQPVSSPIKAEVTEYLESLREVNFVVNVMDPEYTTIDVAFAAVTWPGYDNEEVETAAEAAVTDYLSPATWGQTTYVERGDWINEPVVRYHEVAQVINSVTGLNYITSLTVEGGTVDVDLTGVVALPEAGTITGAVVNPT